MAWLLNELSPKQQALVERARKTLLLVDESLDSVRRISHELRPAMLDDLGLEAAIEWQMEEFRLHNTACLCYLKLNAGNIGLNQQRDTAVFRILQEALTNISRHAQASRVNVGLYTRNSELILEIYDNGIGISEEKISSSKSLGMIGMRERAGALGGYIDISGLTGGGTRLTLTVPLETSYVH
jgi:Signal transduction histidine kinase